MVLFHNMNQVTICIVVATFFLLLFSLKKNPFLAAGVFVQDMFTSRKYLIHFAVMMSILMFNKVELWIESRMVARPEYTSSIYKLEGDFVAMIQHLFENDLLTALSTFFYVVIFPTLMVVSIGVYTYQRNYKLFYAVCYAMMLNYMLAIPFYLFFPVAEVWSFHSHVELLMNKVFPTFETDYRPLSGLDNCFPSLHTSISVSMAVLAARSGNVFWRRFTAFSAVFIIFSIFYLGVHWVTDMCGGLLLGFVASRVALRISEGRSIVAETMGVYLKSRGADK